MTERRFAPRDLIWYAVAFAAVLLAALWVASKTGADLLSHCAYDSYTKQAMGWRDGRIALDQNYEWLELAIYNGKYYVSFPPVPAIPMWVLTFFFGEQTPSGLVNLLYFLGGFVVLMLLLRRYLSAPQAASAAAFAVLGGSVLDIAVSGGAFTGGVWFMAQLMGFLFTALAFYLVDGKSRVGWGIGLVCIALAVGCRPFNALYVPVLLFMLYRKLPKGTVWQTLLKMMPYIAVPALIACAYGVYNYVRFGNPLEFGHAYLPELAQYKEPMFIPGRILENLRNVLRPFDVQGGQLYMPLISGFAVYFTCPLLWMAPVRTGLRALRKKADWTDLLLVVLIVLHAAFLLMHRTNGGWQYGTRYFCDLVPALVFLFARGRQPLRPWETGVIGALITLNVYATIVFHALSSQ